MHLPSYSNYLFGTNRWTDNFEGKFQRDTEQQIEESIQLLWTSHETVEALLFVCRVPSIGRVQVLTDPCMHDSVYLPVLEETDVR